jgi:hypothetical protein
VSAPEADMSWMIEGVIGDAFRALRRDWVALVFGQVVSSLVAMAPAAALAAVNWLPMAFRSHMKFEPGIQFWVATGFTVVSTVVLSLLLAPARSRMALASLRGERVRIRDIFDFRRVGTLFVAGLLAALVTVGASLLLIVPGIIVALGLAFVSFFVVDGEEAPGVLEALDGSWKASRGHRLHFFGLVVLVGVAQAIVKGILSVSKWLQPLTIAVELVEGPLMTLGLGAVYLSIKPQPPVAPPIEAPVDVAI